MMSMGKESKCNDQQVLVVGKDKLTYSIVANLLNAGHEVVLIATDRVEAYDEIAGVAQEKVVGLTITEMLPEEIPQRLIICLTEEDIHAKTQLIQKLEQRAGTDAVIAINTESITIEQLQESCQVPGRILGLNWSYPAQNTFFLEIIGNEKSGKEYIDFVTRIAKEKWCKDPYMVRSGISVRARIMAAWAREALYLVDNGHASIESIDRACRNDAGYYLPFAGNFRYMDLMGTYAYGVVMKDLNPELSKANKVPRYLFENFRQNGASAKISSEELFQQFSQEVRDLIIKYSHEKIDC